MAATEGPYARSDVGLPRAAVVGVLGGGQLGKMLATEAARARPHSSAALLQLWDAGGSCQPRTQPASSARTALVLPPPWQASGGRCGAAGEDGRPRQGAGPDAWLPGLRGGRAHARQLQGPGHDSARARPHTARSFSIHIYVCIKLSSSPYGRALHSALCCGRWPPSGCLPAWPPRARPAAAQRRVQPARPRSARRKGRRRACRRFAAGVDVLTVEIEHIDAGALEAVRAELGVAVEPTPGTLRVIQARALTLNLSRLAPPALARRAPAPASPAGASRRACRGPPAGLRGA